MRSHNPRHYLLYLNFILLLILLLEIGFFIFVFPKVAVTRIELESDLPLSDEDLHELLGFYSPQNYYSVDPEELERHARSFALVKQIEISKELPDLLKVRLESRKPVLVMLQKTAVDPLGSATTSDSGTGERAEEHGGPDKKWQSVPILVDAEAVMFQVGLGRYDDVPVLSGLEFSQTGPPGSLNSRLPDRLYPLVTALGRLRRQRPELYAIISEIHARMGVTDLETDIYFENVPSYIKTGGKIDSHTVETALIALEVLRRSNDSTRYLDMRTTGIVYRSSGKAGPSEQLLRQQRGGFKTTSGNVIPEGAPH